MQVNVGKTRCMGVSGEVTDMVQRTETQRECVVVRWDDGRSEGWNVYCEGRPVAVSERRLDTDDLRDVQPTQLFLYGGAAVVWGMQL